MVACRSPKALIGVQIPSPLPNESADNRCRVVKTHSFSPRNAAALKPGLVRKCWRSLYPRLAVYE